MASHFTIEMRDAIIAGMLERELTAEAAAEAAASGTLAPGLERFVVSPSTARTWSATARRAAAIEHPVDADAEQRVQAVLEQALDVLEEELRAETRKPVGERDVSRIKHVVKTVSELGRLRRRPAGIANGAAGEPAGGDWLDDVAKRAASGNGGPDAA